ncbi:MAG: hypothetical protein LBT78_09040, partial [Tannerella sp.]|nr:hypothetical protein [Tannerella sp.]
DAARSGKTCKQFILQNNSASKKMLANIFALFRQVIQILLYFCGVVGTKKHPGGSGIIVKQLICSIIVNLPCL